MEPAIHCRQLSKSFRFKTVAVNGFDLNVPAGEVYGLIGRNGAGKTTALKLMMGLLRPDGGETRILGRDLWNATRVDRQRVVYVSQGQHAPGWMSLRELGRYAEHFYDQWDGDLMREHARRWDLPMDLAVNKFSGGNQRLASLCLALASRPEVLLLDEPAAGLDPIARRELNSCLIDALLRVEGCTILLSTHLLGDLERLATRTGIMDRGRIIAEGNVEEWQRTMRRVQVVFPGAEAPPDFAIPGAIRTTRLGPVVTALVRVVHDSQLVGVRSIPGVRVNLFSLTLEELFVDWFRDTAEDPPTVPPSVPASASSLGQPGLSVAWRQT